MYDAAITFYPVRDLAASARFYRDALGLPLVLDQGGIQIYRVAPGGYFGLCASDQAVQPEQRLILTLVTAEVEAASAQVLAAGFITDGPPRENPRYQIFHFFTQDPDGYRVEVQRFLHPFG